MRVGVRGMWRGRANRWSRRRARLGGLGARRILHLRGVDLRDVMVRKG